MSAGAGPARPFDELLSHWEKSAAELAGAFVRDPRTLEFGASLLRTQLAWKRAGDAIFDAACAPFTTADRGEGGR